MYVETPLIPSVFFPQKVWLKLENNQPSGSFKSRGMTAVVKKGLESAPHGHVFSSSGGNAGLATAEAAGNVNAPCTVVVPVPTSQRMVDRIEKFGAKVVLHGDVWQDANDYLNTELLPKAGKGGIFCHPFDDPQVWAGHSTLVDELVKQLDYKKPGGIVLSVGGGGLYAGVMLGLEKHNWTDVPVYAVETTNASCLHAALEAGKPVDTTPTSIARSLGASRVAQKAFDYAKKYKTTSILVSDDEAIDACRQFASDHCMIVEPACGATLAAIYKQKVKVDGDLVAIVCGGSTWTAEHIHPK